LNQLPINGLGENELEIGVGFGFSSFGAGKALRIDILEPRHELEAQQMAESKGHLVFYVDKFLNPLKHKDSIVEAAGSYNAALDLIHTALRAESEGERYTGVLHCSTLAFALRV
jgi:hypothetical protein